MSLERTELEDRLQQLSACQHDRLASESAEEREIRLQDHRDWLRGNKGGAAMHLLGEFPWSPASLTVN